MNRWVGAALALAAVWLVGCAQHEATPVSQDAVRVTLGTVAPADRISAYRVNGELVRRLRFDDLPPGAYRLQVRFEYEAPGRSSARGNLGPTRRSCILQVDYDAFMAGNEYRVVAQRLGWANVGWLESPQGERLVSAREIRCGPSV